MKHLPHLAILLIGSTLFSSPAAAWECIDPDCPVRCEIPTTYYVGHIPAELDEDAVLAAIAEAFGAWSAVDCAIAEATYAARFLRRRS